MPSSYFLRRNTSCTKHLTDLQRAQLDSLRILRANLCLTVQQQSRFLFFLSQSLFRNLENMLSPSKCITGLAERLLLNSLNLWTLTQSSG